MKLIKGQTAEILAITGVETLPGTYNEPNKLIELAGRTCYKSEDKITEDSATKFVDMLKSNKHGAMLEHSWQARRYVFGQSDIIKALYHGKYLHFVFEDDRHTVVTGNDRAFSEWETKVESISPRVYQVPYAHEVLTLAEKYNAPELLSMTAKFVTNRGVTHELVRHRPPSFAQESTRWCNYGNERFGQHCTFIIPSWAYDYIPEGEYSQVDVWNMAHSLHNSVGEGLQANAISSWIFAVNSSEQHYFNLLKNGKKLEEARDVLPNALKTEIIVTADLQEWEHILNLRFYGTSGKPHFQMKELMENFLQQRSAALGL